MSTAHVKQKHYRVPAKKINELASKLPKGWKFRRAARTRTEHGETGVRLWFSHKPIAPPTPKLKPQAAEALLEMTGDNFKRAAYVQGKDGIEVEFEKGAKVFLPRVLADGFFDYIPERRPKLRLLDPGKPMPTLEHCAAHAAQSAQAATDVVLDVFIKLGDCAAFFNLGDNVEIRGVRGDWEGEPVVGRGICKGLLLRCVEV